MLKQFHRLILASERAFTLIEMLIVLMIISILLLIAVPQMTNTQKVVQNKSTDATVQLVQAQVAAYQMDHDGDLPSTLDELEEGGYVDHVTAPNGDPLSYDPATGKVSAP